MWAWHGRGTYVRAALLSETNKAAARRQTILKLCGYLSSAPSSACLLLPLATSPLPHQPFPPWHHSCCCRQTKRPGRDFKKHLPKLPKERAKSWLQLLQGSGAYAEARGCEGERGEIAYEPGSLLASSQNIDRRWQPQRGVSAEPPLATA